ncbi:hypothetical protein CEXT_361241 [Caerostris extrusa]|uniref:Secreted protein n=1 Tax=Caerostris extrusa TaxID=172846 RepID=A0AAV4Y8C1_CAEEX|nr:hypothetical protein CEXT_361241 [Caerostris extrusa]
MRNDARVKSMFLLTIFRPPGCRHVSHSLTVQGLFCVKTMGMMSFCRSAAKRLCIDYRSTGGMCSVTQGANRVYNNLPPCVQGLKCQGVIVSMRNFICSWKI